jgi:hypothetical protein
MIKAKYRFERPANSSLGFGRINRPSTDALGALYRWANAESGLTYAKSLDEDQLLEAEITCDSSDIYAGSHLDMLCAEHGVQRQPI